MSELTKDRQFQLWEYHVSHGSLLIRSPAAPALARSIDLIFVGVEYLNAPRHLGEIAVSEATADEIQRLQEILQKRVVSSRVWALQSSRGRFLVVAAALKVQEHIGDIFDSPFDQGLDLQHP
jgi:hypothetical protein